jgi:hypothetical protein
VVHWGRTRQSNFPLCSDNCFTSDGQHCRTKPLLQQKQNLHTAFVSVREYSPSHACEKPVPDPVASFQAASSLPLSIVFAFIPILVIALFMHQCPPWCPSSITVARHGSTSLKCFACRASTVSVPQFVFPIQSSSIPVQQPHHETVPSLGFFLVIQFVTP